MTPLVTTIQTIAAPAGRVLLSLIFILSGALFHLIPSFGAEGMEAQIQSIMFMKNLTIAGGMGMVVAFGAGAWSLDNRGATPVLSAG